MRPSSPYKRGRDSAGFRCIRVYGLQPWGYEEGGKWYGKRSDMNFERARVRVRTEDCCLIQNVLHPAKGTRAASALLRHSGGARAETCETREITCPKSSTTVFFLSLSLSLTLLVLFLPLSFTTPPHTPLYILLSICPSLRRIYTKTVISGCYGNGGGGGGCDNDGLLEGRGFAPHIRPCRVI